MAAITYIEEICVYSFEFFKVKYVHLYILEVGEFENYRKNLIQGHFECQGQIVKIQIKFYEQNINLFKKTGTFITTKTPRRSVFVFFKF